MFPKVHGQLLEEAKLESGSSNSQSRALITTFLQWHVEDSKIRNPKVPLKVAASVLMKLKRVS